MVPIFSNGAPSSISCQPVFPRPTESRFPALWGGSQSRQNTKWLPPPRSPLRGRFPGNMGSKGRGKSAYMLPNMPHGRRVSDAFPRQAHIRGVTSATGPARHRPARPLGASPPAGPSRRRRPLTRIGPARPHPVTQGDSRTRSLRPGTPLVPPAGRHTRQWPEKCAPDGVPSWVFAGRRKRPPVRGALFGLSGSTCPFTRGPRPLATPGQGWVGRKGGVGVMRL